MAPLRVIADHDPLDALVAASGQDRLGFWRDIYDTVSEALIIVSPERRVLFANRPAQALLSMPMHEAQGQACLEAMQCPQCQCMCRLFETGQMNNVEVTLFTPERRIFRKSGRLLRGTDGQILGGVETFVDITLEYEARAARERRADGLFEHRAEAGMEGVFSVDATLRIQDFSAQMTHLTGFALHEAQGRHLLDLLKITDLGPAQEALRRGVPASKALADQQVRVKTIRRDGSPVTLQLSFLALHFGSEALLGLARPEARATLSAEDLERQYGFAGMISRASVMQDLFRLLENVAHSDANVLIQGESGAGKELVARAVHTLSARKARPFFAVNCATFTGGLLLSELFGHERGSFTGAYKTQRGKLELAEGGTLLLDEVSEIPIQHQALLLRVLESRRFERLGGTESIPLSARVLAATNRPLSEAVDDGSFRRDLFFRLNVVPVRVPPLRERPEDIGLLLRYFALQLQTADRPVPPEINAPVLRALEAYPWPGNVRELKNLVEYLCFVCDGALTLDHLPSHILRRSEGSTGAPVLSSPARTPASGLTSHAATERARVQEALEHAGGKRSEAARTLGMDRTTLWRKMKKLGLSEWR